jgi:cytochrome P450
MSFDPWAPGFVADPYPAYEELRAAGRAHWFEPSGQWLIPRHEDVGALLRDRRLGRTYLHRFTHEEFGRTSPPPEHEPFHVLNDSGLLDLEAPDHTRIRRLVSKAFTPRTVQRPAPTVERLAGELVAGLVADGGGDLVDRLAEPLPVAVIAEMLGISLPSCRTNRRPSWTPAATPAAVPRSGRRLRAHHPVGARARQRQPPGSRQHLPCAGTHRAPHGRVRAVVEVPS